MVISNGLLFSIKPDSFANEVAAPFTPYIEWHLKPACNTNIRLTYVMTCLDAVQNNVELHITTTDFDASMARHLSHFC